MTKISLPHTKDDELQTVSINDWIIDLQLHFDKSDIEHLRKLIYFLDHFLKNPMDWYIWIDYIDVWWDITYWLWYQDKQWNIQIWFNGVDVWLNLTKTQLSNSIKKLHICYSNLLDK